eukprot:comp22382_c0_seq1/m.33375 comp22382_c0_seq1/g.33375  ORF comp22382_c0_seq1/g.33375 comp22382_c0_seq1/m.33375 type:complete len:391 (-) comp22382_c0_seq1:48-1220(-)
MPDVEKNFQQPKSRAMTRWLLELLKLSTWIVLFVSAAHYDLGAIFLAFTVVFAACAVFFQDTTLLTPFPFVYGDIQKVVSVRKTSTTRVRFSEPQTEVLEKQPFSRSSSNSSNSSSSSEEREIQSELKDRACISSNSQIELSLCSPLRPIRVLRNPTLNPDHSHYYLYIPDGFFKNIAIYDSKGQVVFHVNHKSSSMHHKYSLVDPRTGVSYAGMRNLFASKGPFPVACTMITDATFKSQHAIVYGTRSYYGHLLAEGKDETFPTDTPYRVRIWNQPMNVDDRLPIMEGRTLGLVQSEKSWQMVGDDGKNTMEIVTRGGSTHWRHLRNREATFLIGVAADTDTHFMLMTAIAMLRRTALYYSKYDDVWDPVTGRYVDSESDHIPTTPFLF